ncbi:hypothetical protein LZ016_00125 [Sphingomonas sp. SM33]|uniref:Uncharacterized protein n=1 Tax=Sphingomonas telluris TaxID=2907998 RepID=A0ABS9VHS7_9SPHN|nr:hypothetical protein [Sphingomonas telluris]MCH8614516.1 hypothetical protein [Sphingomonas telluris]
MRAQYQAPLEQEAQLMPTHTITLTAKQISANVIQVTGNGKRKLPGGSGEHRFKFKLDDETTTKCVLFKSMVSADCSTCPPDLKQGNTQIYGWSMNNNPTRGKYRRAQFMDRNDNDDPMDVSYQLEFTCVDKSIKVLPFDPVITNGGKT